MRVVVAAFSLLCAAALGGTTAQGAERQAEVRLAQATPYVAPTGRVMPPPTGREPPSGLRPTTEMEMLKAQKAAEERNKAWDSKMRRTMGTICNGC